MSEEGIAFQVDLEGVKNDIKTIENLSSMMIEMEKIPSEREFFTLMCVIRRTADEAYRKIEEPMQEYKDVKNAVKDLIKRSGSK